MSPLRHFRQWTETQAAPLLETASIPLYQVDAHNIVPVWMASPKREVGARTLRPKINNLFSKYCTHFPEFSGNSHLREEVSSTHDWEQYREFMNLDESIQSVDGMKAGHDVAMERFHEFCSSTQYGL
jgi:deoxyribodipyrimidine photo-lyase